MGPVVKLNDQIDTKRPQGRQLAAERTHTIIRQCRVIADDAVVLVCSMLLYLYI